VAGIWRAGGRRRRDRPPALISPAEAPQVHQMAVADDPERQARNPGILHLPADIRVHRGEAGRGRLTRGSTLHHASIAHGAAQRVFNEYISEIFNLETQVKAEQSIIPHRRRPQIPSDRPAVGAAMASIRGRNFISLFLLSLRRSV
jgi:hypothetical protein